MEKITAKELQLAANADFIYTKNTVIEKVIDLFGEVAEDYKTASQMLLADWPQLFAPHPKISKGEKHEALPWVMLDYPRMFDKASGQFAIRTFFWWGNFFSIQLQVSGGFKNRVLQVLPHWPQPAGEWYIGFTHDAWNMQLPNTGWAVYNRGDANPTSADYLADDIVLKIAKKIPIGEWESVQLQLAQYFTSLMGLATNALAT